MSNETILVLDEDPHIQWTLKTLLECEEYIVMGVKTIERVVQNFSEFEVSGLISEYWIGNYCALETIREIKKRFPEVYVMVLAHDGLDEHKYEEMMHSGVDDFFLKPISTKKILLHLQKGLRQRSISLVKNRLERELDLKGKRPDNLL